jgi:hypothetical protein
VELINQRNKKTIDMKKIAYSLMAMAIAAFTFTSCEDVPAPFGQPTDPGSGEGGDVVVIEPSGSGTEADPYNVAAAIEIAKAMSGDDAAKQVVAIGYITSIDEIDTDGTFGNATYYISDDKDGKANKLEIYRGYGLNGQKFNAPGATIIKEGDLVVVSGGLVNFRGTTLEFTQGSKLLSINGVSGGGDTPSTETIGTKDNPITVAKALELTNALADNAETDEAFVKGKISKVQSYNGTYKSITYYISDDGTESNELQVYSGKGLNGAEFASETDLAAGDEVVVKGKLKKYVNKSGAVTLEMNQPNEIVSIVKGSGGGGGGTDTGLGTADKPLTVTKALEVVNALADNGETETEAFVKGKISKVQSYNDKYKSITYYISDDGAENNELQIYSGKGLNGAEFASAEDLSAGDLVVVKGKLKKYVNKSGAVTLEMNQPNEIVSITKASGGGDEPSGDGSEIKAVFGELGLSGDLSVVTLADGTKLTFAQGGGKNPPIYHSSTSIIRMYAQNEVTIDAGSKKIAKVVFAYDTYNGTAYKGNDEMYGQAGNTKITPTKDDANVTFSGVNSSTLKVVNDFTSNSGGTQFRITSVTIVYAK